MSLRAAAMRFNIPKSTLFDRVVRARKRSNNNMEDSGNEGGESEEELASLKYTKRQVFSQKEEIELGIYLKKSSDMLRLDIWSLSWTGFPICLETE